MAGDWIKMRTDLYRDPKVCVIADELMSEDGELAAYVNQMKQCDMSVTRNVTRNATVGSLVTVWGVMRHRGKRVDNDLLCRGVTLSIIDDVADMPGFGAAMAVVSWAIETEEGVVFPNFFDDYNVDPSEKKASKAAERQRRYRESKKQNGDVTRDVTRDVTVTHREEKSREEKKNINGDEYAADFLEFWNGWPDGHGAKGSKAQAYAAWKSLKTRPEPQALIAAARAQAAEKTALSRGGQFAAPFKHVCRWLKGREWENEVSEISRRVAV